METMNADEARRQVDAAVGGTLPDPERWPEIVDAIVAADEAKDEIAAIGRILDSAVEASPEAPGMFVARGEVYRALGHLAVAADEMAYACELARTDDPDPWLRLASIEAALERWDEAANALDQALEHGAEDPELFARLGEAHLEAGDATRAIASFEEGLEERPSDPLLRLGRARASLDLELYEDAIEDCVAAEASHEHPAAVFRVHARALIGQRQDARAIEMLDRAIAAEPTDAESFRLRGDLLSSAGNVAGAAENYRSAQAIEPDDETEIALADCLIEVGDPGGALEIARGLLERIGSASRAPHASRTFGSVDLPSVDEFDANIVIARALRAMNREAEALETLHSAIEIDPEAAEPYLERSEIHSAAGRSNLAWRDARWAIDRDPESIDAYLMRGRLALEIESASEALGDFEAALQLDPGNGQVRAWRGRAFALAGDMKAAAADWELAERDLPSGHALLASIAQWRDSS